MSAAVWAKNPRVSRLFARGSTPWVGRRPYVGLNPQTPQYEAGRITDPPVWVPIEKGAIPAATAAAEPLELPPGVCSGLRGLRVGPGVRYANCVVRVLPRSTAPRARRSRTTQASDVPIRPL